MDWTCPLLHDIFKNVLLSFLGSHRTTFRAICRSWHSCVQGLDIKRVGRLVGILFGMEDTALPRVRHARSLLYKDFFLAIYPEWLCGQLTSLSVPYLTHSCVHGDCLPAFRVRDLTLGGSLSAVAEFATFIQHSTTLRTLTLRTHMCRTDPTIGASMFEAVRANSRLERLVISDDILALQQPVKFPHLTELLLEPCRIKECQKLPKSAPKTELLREMLPCLEHLGLYGDPQADRLLTSMLGLQTLTRLSCDHVTFSAGMIAAICATNHLRSMELVTCNYTRLICDAVRSGKLHLHRLKIPSFMTVLGYDTEEITINSIISLIATSGTLVHLEVSIPRAWHWYPDIFTNLHCGSSLQILTLLGVQVSVLDRALSKIELGITGNPSCVYCHSSDKSVALMTRRALQNIWQGLQLQLVLGNGRGEILDLTAMRDAQSKMDTIRETVNYMHVDAMEYFN